jgi:hypothetical protein
VTVGLSLTVGKTLGFKSKMSVSLETVLYLLTFLNMITIFLGPLTTFLVTYIIKLIPEPTHWNPEDGGRMFLRNV